MFTFNTTENSLRKEVNIKCRENSQLQRWDSNPRCTPYEGELVPSPVHSALFIFYKYYNKNFLKNQFIATFRNVRKTLKSDLHITHYDKELYT